MFINNIECHDDKLKRALKRTWLVGASQSRIDVLLVGKAVAAIFVARVVLLSPGVGGGPLEKRQIQTSKRELLTLTMDSKQRASLPRSTRMYPSSPQNSPPEPVSSRH